MSVMFFAAIVVLLMASRLRGLGLIALATVPGGVAVWFLWSSTPDAAVMRIRLAAVRYLDESAVGAAPAPLNVRFGGDRTDDDFFIARLPAQFAEVRLLPAPSALTADRAKQAQQWNLAVRYGVPENSSGEPAGIRGVAALLTDGGWRLLGETALQSGDVIHSERADFRADIKVVGSGRLIVNSKERVLPLLRTKVPVLGYTINTWKVPGALTRTYSLEGLIKSVSTDAASALGSSDDADKALSSFFFFKPDRAGFGGTLNLALLDPTVTVIRGSRTIAFERDHVLAGGTAGVRVRFYGLGVPNRQFSERFERSGVRDLRSGSLEAPIGEHPSLIFRFDSDADSPEVISFTPSALQRLNLGSADGATSQRDSRIHLGLVAEPFLPRSIVFSALPKRFAVGGQAILQERKDGTMALLTPGGQLDVRLGEGVWLGDTAQALIQFDRVSPSVGLLVLIACLAVASATLLAAVNVEHHWFTRLWSPVLLLLSMKLLLGFRAFNKYPANYKSLALALVSLAFVPWLMATVRLATVNERRTTGAVAWMHLMTAAIVVVLSAGLGEPLFAGLVIIVWLMTIASPEVARALKPSLQLRQILRKIARPGRGWLFASGAGFTLLAFRILTVWLGFRERLALPGVPIAISIIYTPLMLCAYAALSTKWFGWKGRAAWLQILAAWVLFVAFACAGVGLATSDLGIPLLLVWPLALDGLRAVHHRLWRPWTAWLLLGTAAALVLELGVPRVVNPDAFNPRPDGRRDVQLTHWDRNWLRLYGYAYPSGMDKIGLRDSDNLAIMHDVLAKYAQAGWSGAGYQRGDVTAVLGPTILREHVPAVFVESDFGIAGGVFLGFLYLAVGASCWHGRRAVRNVSRERYFYGAFGELCLTTFALSSIWMLLANLNMVPFTGKNVYLFGLDSGGDVMESSVLLALGVWSSCRAERAVPSGQPKPLAPTPHHPAHEYV